METKYIINRLYDLMIEANLNRPDEEVLIEINEKKDTDIDEYISRIQLYRTKSKAVLNKHRFKQAKNELIELIDKYHGKLSELFNPQEYELLQRFHRKYENSTEKDEQSMMENKKLLELLRKLKDDVND